MKRGYLLVPVLVLTGIAVSLIGCSKETQKEISYANQIRPILESNCLECHTKNGPGTVASGLNMESYDALMKGTKFGPVIKAGDAISSTIMILIDGRADPSINMPHGDRAPLSSEQIKLMEQWINQGAKNN